MAVQIPSTHPDYPKILALLREQAEAGSEHARGELAKLERAGKQARTTKGERLPVIRENRPNQTCELWIPDWHPSSANKREGWHWSTKNRLKKTDREIVIFHVQQSGLDVDERPKRVDATFYYPNRRHWHDKDNLRKALYDSLAKAHVLYDDKDPWCDQGDIVQEIGDKGTLIRLEDME